MLTLFLTAAAILFSAPAQAQLLPPPAPGEYQLRGEFSYFKTTANFDGTGSKSALLNGASLSTMNGLGEFIFDWTEEIRLHAGLVGGQTTANRQSTLATPVEAHTNAGLSEAWVGGQYWYHYAAFDLVPDLELHYPLFRVDLNSGDPLLGEGALRLNGGAWLVGQWGDWRPFGFLGYEYRDEGRATLMPYHLGLQWLPENGWWAQAEMRGYQTLTNDTNTDNGTVRDLYLARIQGGSERFYSLNPASHELAVMLGTHFGQMGIYAGGAMTFMGKNSADGLTFTVGLTFDGSFYVPTPRVEEPLYQDRFSPKDEKFDEKVFDSSPVPRPPTPVKTLPVHTRTRPAAKKPAPAKAGTAGKGPLPTVELLMKSTEKALEKEDKRK